VLSDVRIGFERTIEQDIGFGIRQQIDIACKALSPAVNDPYTAVQAIDHLTVVCCDLAVRPLGAQVLSGPGGRGRVVVPGNNFADYIFFIGGLFGRYGSSDVTVMLALIRLFRTCVEVLPAGSDRLDVLDQAAEAALADAERSMPRPTDLERIRAAVLRTQQDQLTAPAMTSGRPPPPPPGWPRPNDPLFFHVKMAQSSVRLHRGGEVRAAERPKPGV
jgi:uncharacterized membrane protein